MKKKKREAEKQQSIPDSLTAQSHSGSDLVSEGAKRSFKGGG